MTEPGPNQWGVPIEQLVAHLYERLDDLGMHTNGVGLGHEPNRLSYTEDRVEALLAQLTVLVQDIGALVLRANIAQFAPSDDG